MGWLNELELVRLLRTVMVSVDDVWDIAGIRLDAVYFLVLLCGYSILSYCMEIYHLVKRTTMAETMIGMLLPGMAALFGAMWLTEYGSLPSGQVLTALAEQPFSLALSVQITACAVLFVIVFVITELCWRKKLAGKARCAAYALDFLTALMAFAAGGYGVFTNVVLHRGENLFAGNSLVFGIFLYLLPLLLFKTFLLLLLALLRVYGARITVFPYRQGMHAGRYLYRWLLLYHCPLLREVLAFVLMAGLLLLKVYGGVPQEDGLFMTACFDISKSFAFAFA